MKKVTMSVAALSIAVMSYGQTKIAKEYGLDKLTTKEIVIKEFDQWMDKLITRNGTTKY